MLPEITQQQTDTSQDLGSDSVTEDSPSFDIDNLTALPEASDEDLEQALAQGLTEESSQTTEPPVTEPQAPPVQEDAKQPAEKQADEVRLSKEEWERIQQQLNQKEHFIKRRNDEIGAQRKQIRELRQQLQQQNQELERALDDAGDLRAARQITKQIDRNEQQLEKIDAAEQQLSQSEQMETFVDRSKQIVQAMVPAEDLDWNKMADTLRRDGIPEQAVQQIMSNPFATTPPETLVHLAKRTKAENMLGILAHAYKAERDRATELEKKLNSAPGNVLAKVQNALNTPQPMNGGAAGAKPKASVPYDAESLSDEELDSALKAAMGR